PWLWREDLHSGRFSPTFNDAVQQMRLQFDDADAASAVRTACADCIWWNGNSLSLFGCEPRTRGCGEADEAGIKGGCASSGKFLPRSACGCRIEPLQYHPYLHVRRIRRATLSRDGVGGRGKFGWPD